MTPYQEKEKSFILLADIYACFLRHWLKIFVIAGIFTSIGVWYALNQPVRYRVYGSFKEAKGGGEQYSRGQAIQSFLQQVGFTTANQSCHVIRSVTLIQKVVEELGLQASVIRETPWQKRMRTIRENWIAERGGVLKEVDDFVFAHVKYEEEIQKSYSLSFQSPTQFKINDASNTLLVSGELGESLIFDNVKLTIVKAPKDLKLNHSYPLSIVPRIATISGLLGQLEIGPHIKDPTVYEFIFLYRDRKLAKKVIDRIMAKYQDYLREETERISLEQIAYLEKRKDELFVKMDSYLEDHVSYLKENLGMNGFLNLSQHLQHMSGRKQKFLDQSLSLDTERARLDSWGGDSSAVTMKGDLGALQRDMQEFKKQRDTIDLAFSFNKKKRVKRLYPPYAPREEALYTYRDQLSQVSAQEEKIRLAEEGDSSGIVSLFPGLFATLNQFSEMRMKEWARTGFHQSNYTPALAELKQVRLRKSELAEALKTANQEDLVHCIDHQLRIASIQESILKERLFYPRRDPEAFQGIDLATARKLYCEYIHIRDGHETKVRQLNFSKNHLEDPDFEYISLVQILPDGISQNLARSIGELVQSMRDTRNLSERDLERMERRLKRDQVNLKRHIDQTIELAELQISLVEERLDTVQSVILDLLNQEISLIDQQIRDRVKQQKNALLLEKQLISDQIEEIEAELVNVPDQWLKEHQLEFSSDMNMSMLDSMVKMVESKNIEHNLIRVQSMPIDLAYSSLATLPPRLKIFGLVGVFIGVLIGIAIVIGMDFSRGFPLTFKNLQLQGKKVCGRFKRRKVYHHLDEMKREDLQILRSLSAMISKNETGQVVTLLSGKGSDYAYPLGELLIKEDKRVLLLNLDHKSKEPGLFAYLKGDAKNYSVKKKGAVDYIPMGQMDSYLIELLKRPLFEAFLEEQKKQFDVILFHASFLPGSPEGQFFMTISDLIALTLNDESNDTLSPYYAWEEAGKTLTFVAS